MERVTLKILFFMGIAILVSSSDPVVTTELGEIIGKTTTLPLDLLPYKDVHQYLGIPYAKAPVGERRFLKPEVLSTLNTPYDAKSHGSMCPQSTFGPIAVTMSEDCLFLNVYVPDQPSDKPSGHAVMVWIHGGGFREGAGSQYDGSFIAAYGNVIVVTINYRLGLFGFLSTGDKTVPGNAGLWDQRMALQWVHTHIESFGGDKGRVTVVGGSAGAISTMLQGFMPDNHGLFQRIITQSGSISMPVNDMEKDVKSDFKLIATTVGCLEDDISDIVACLRGKSVEDLLSGISPIAFSLNFSPIIDDDFLKINPQHISRLSESERLNEVEFFRSLDILSGFNAYEGVFFLPFMLLTNQIEDFTPSREEMSNQLVPNALKYLYKKQTFQNEITKLVEAQHTTWTNPSDSDNIRLQLVKIIGDGSFCVPAIEISRLHKQSTSSRNFMYHFTPNPSYRRLPMPSWLPGSTHADEVPFMFGSTDKVGVGEENAWELVLLTNMVTYWTNFIKSGDPNRPTAITPHWPEYNLETGDYLKLEKSMSNSSAGQYFYEEEANFWLHVFPDLVNAISKEDGGCDHDNYSNAASTFSFVIYTLIFGVVLGLSCFL